MGDLRPEGRRFVFELPYFLSYLQQDKLFYLLGGLAVANVLALVPQWLVVVVLPDVEDVTGKIDLDAGDPVRQRVVELIGNQRPQEALQVIEELEREGRGDLGVLKAQAMNLLRMESFAPAAQQWQQLIERKQWREAAEFWKSADDVDELVLSNPEPVVQLIGWCREKRYDGLAVQLCLSLEKHYSRFEQVVVDYLFLAAKILYQNRKVSESVKLLERTIGRYREQADVSALQSYLTGVHKMDKIRH